MDIRMPELDGLEATHPPHPGDRHHRAGTDPHHVRLGDYVFEALRSGASGFVLKDDPPEQLLAAVRTIAAGEALPSPAVARRVIRHFTRLNTQQPPPGGVDADDPEVEVFELITRGLSNARSGGSCSSATPR
jgi:DNA-binding NarL/FixJ family response regulator